MTQGNNKVAIITGASRGIGAAIAQRLAHDGFTVVLNYAGKASEAEALTAKLCHVGDDFVYEITLLNRDGRIVHVEMGAATGKLVVRPAHEPRETHDAHESHEPQVKN